MHKHIRKEFKGFLIDIHIGSETISAYWVNGELENSRRFSGYSVNEIMEIIKYEIETMELMP
jgi:hypothetical protein